MAYPAPIRCPRCGRELATPGDRGLNLSGSKVTLLRGTRVRCECGHTQQISVSFEVKSGKAVGEK